MNQLSKKINVTRQGARYLIKELVNENKVEIKGKGYKNTLIFGLR